jgi:hypothetical protein
MRPLSAMLDSLVRPLLDDEVRLANAMASYTRASEVGRRLPLVHRTCKPDAEADWLDVLRSRRFTAREPCTVREKAAGIPAAAYFFLGCGAYPDGLVGFVLDGPSVLTRPGTYVPFDSGGIDHEKHAVPTAPAQAAAWDEAAKDRFLADHLGAGDDVAAFAGPYLAAHFREPMTYVRCGQYGVPDFPVYHGLRSPNDDRRSWTIEVHVHEHVPFGSGSGMLTEIVAARWSLVEELPEDLKGFARVATMENEVLESIAEGIAERIGAEVP